MQGTPQLASVCESFSKEAGAVMQQQAGNKQLLRESPPLLAPPAAALPPGAEASAAPLQKLALLQQLGQLQRPPQPACTRRLLAALPCNLPHIPTPHPCSEPDHAAGDAGGAAADGHLRAQRHLR
jgi:hypothetical protein